MENENEKERENGLRRRGREKEGWIKRGRTSERRKIERKGENGMEKERNRDKE